MTDIYRPYTMVGNRRISKSFRRELAKYAEFFAVRGFTARSGRSGMSDLACEEGVANYCKITRNKPLVELYTPWAGFYVTEDHLPAELSINLSEEDRQRNRDVLLPILGNIDRLSDPVASLHLRNVNQIIGSTEHKKDSEFVIYVANEDPANRAIEGGTRTAVYLARSLNIPTFNITIQEDRDLLSEFLYHLE